MQQICRSIFQELFEHNKGNWVAFQHDIGAIVRWLSENDAEWISQFKSKLGLRNLSDVDDMTLAGEVEGIVSIMRNSQGKPQRLSFQTIMNRLGIKRPLRAKMTKHPLTLETISRLEDTLESFTVRRLEFAARQFFEMKIYPTKNQLRQRANIYDKLPSETIDNLLNQAFDYLDALIKHSNL